MAIEETRGMFRIKTNEYYQGEVVFTEKEVDAIEAAEKSSILQNFPFPEKWNPLPVFYKKSYFARQNWIGLGKVGEEPKVVSIKQILEPIEIEQKETEEPVALNEAKLSQASEDSDLAEFLEWEEKCKKEAEKEEAQQVAMRKKTETEDDVKPRPISIVPPLPRFIKPPTKINRSDSTLSTGSNVSLDSNSSRRSQSSKKNAHSLVDTTSGPTKSKALDYYPIANKREFLPTEPNKNQPAKVDNTSTTPTPKRKDKVDFIKRNKENAGKFFRRNNGASKDMPTTSESLTFTRQ